MADEITEAADEQQPEETTAADESAEYWKKQARKWESLAKKARAAEVELEEMTGGNSPELDEAIKRADRAERELEEMRASIAKSKAARALAAETGVPAELLEFCATTEEMEGMAKAYKAQAPRIHAAAVATGPRIIRNDGPAPTPQNIFAEWARGKL